MEVAGLRSAYATARPLYRAADLSRGEPVLLDYRGDTQGPFERAVSTAKGGHYCLDTLSWRWMQRKAASAMRSASRR